MSGKRRLPLQQAATPPPLPLLRGTPQHISYERQLIRDRQHREEQKIKATQEIRAPTSSHQSQPRPTAPLPGTPAGAAVRSQQQPVRPSNTGQPRVVNRARTPPSDDDFVIPNPRPLPPHTAAGRDHQTARSQPIIISDSPPPIIVIDSPPRTTHIAAARALVQLQQPATTTTAPAVAVVVQPVAAPPAREAPTEVPLSWHLDTVIPVNERRGKKRRRPIKKKATAHVIPAMVAEDQVNSSEFSLAADNREQAKLRASRETERKSSVAKEKEKEAARERKARREHADMVQYKDTMWGGLTKSGLEELWSLAQDNADYRYDPFDGVYSLYQLRYENGVYGQHARLNQLAINRLINKHLIKAPETPAPIAPPFFVPRPAAAVPVPIPVAVQAPVEVPPPPLLEPPRAPAAAPAMMILCGVVKDMAASPPHAPTTTMMIENEHARIVSADKTDDSSININIALVHQTALNSSGLHFQTRHLAGLKAGQWEATYDGTLYHISIVELPFDELYRFTIWRAPQLIDDDMAHDEKDTAADATTVLLNHVDTNVTYMVDYNVGDYLLIYRAVAQRHMIIKITALHLDPTDATQYIVRGTQMVTNNDLSSQQQEEIIYQLGENELVGSKHHIVRNSREVCKVIPVTITRSSKQLLFEPFCLCSECPCSFVQRFEFSGGIGSPLVREPSLRDADSDLDDDDDTRRVVQQPKSKPIVDSSLARYFDVQSVDSNTWQSMTDVMRRKHTLDVDNLRLLVDATVRNLQAQEHLTGSVRSSATAIAALQSFNVAETKQSEPDPVAMSEIIVASLMVHYVKKESRERVATILAKAMLDEIPTCSMFAGLPTNKRKQKGGQVLEPKSITKDREQILRIMIRGILAVRSRQGPDAGHLSLQAIHRDLSTIYTSETEWMMDARLWTTGAPFFHFLLVLENELKAQKDTTAEAILAIYHSMIDTLKKTPPMTDQQRACYRTTYRPVCEAIANDAYTVANSGVKAHYPLEWHSKLLFLSNRMRNEWEWSTRAVVAMEALQLLQFKRLENRQS